MCGIIGYIGPKDVVPVLIDGLRQLEYRGYDSAGVAVVRDGAVSLRRSAGKLVESRAGDRRRSDLRRLRRRPHALGDARPADRGERPSAPRLHRQDRRRPQRHHRELSRSEAGAAAAGPQVRHRDRHRDRRASGRARDEDRRARERRAPRAAADARAVRARAHLGRRSRRRSSPSATVRRSSSASATASSSSRPTFPPILSHTRDVVFLGDEEMAVITTDRRRVHRLLRTPGLEGDAARAVGSDHGGEGRLQALHAQGDLRAADGRARNDPRPRLAGHRQGVPRGDEHHRRAAGRPSTASRSWRAARRGTRHWSASS